MNIIQNFKFFPAILFYLFLFKHLKIEIPRCLKFHLIVLFIQNSPLIDIINFVGPNIIKVEINGSTIFANLNLSKLFIANPQGKIYQFNDLLSAPHFEIVSPLTINFGPKYIYHGEMSLGRRHGYGILYMSILKARLRFEWNQIPAQKCVLDYYNGNRYIGQIKENIVQPSGKGILYNKDGRRVEGYFKNGLATGNIRCYYPDGQYFYGSVKKGKCHGWGRRYLPNGIHYKEYWQNGNEIRGTRYYNKGVKAGYYGGIRKKKYIMDKNTKFTTEIVTHLDLIIAGKFRERLPHGSGYIEFKGFGRTYGNFENGDLVGYRGYSICVDKIKRLRSVLL